MGEVRDLWDDLEKLDGHLKGYVRVAKEHDRRIRELESKADSPRPTQ